MTKLDALLALPRLGLWHRCWCSPRPFYCFYFVLILDVRSCVDLVPARGMKAFLANSNWGKEQPVKQPVVHYCNICYNPGHFLTFLVLLFTWISLETEFAMLWVGVFMMPLRENEGYQSTNQAIQGSECLLCVKVISSLSYWNLKQFSAQHFYVCVKLLYRWQPSMERNAHLSSKVELQLWSHVEIDFSQLYNFLEDFRTISRLRLMLS